MDSKILGTPFVLSDSTTVSVVNIVTDRPSDWLVLLSKSGKRICSSFKECYIPFYECLFTRINLQLLLCEFEVEMLKLLKVPPRSFILVFGLL